MQNFFMLTFTVLLRNRPSCYSSSVHNVATRMNLLQNCANTVHNQLDSDIIWAIAYHLCMHDVLWYFVNACE